MTGLNAGEKRKTFVIRCSVFRKMINLFLIVMEKKQWLGY